MNTCNVINTHRIIRKRDNTDTEREYKANIREKSEKMIRSKKECMKNNIRDKKMR